jgi:xanthine dehydrogenase accessory factor
MNRKEFFRRITKLLDEGREFAVVRVVASEGSAPQEPGAGMIVFPDSVTEDTIGGGRFEAQVILDAVGLLREGGRFLRRSYEFTPAELGMHCSGRAEVLMEAFRSPWKLWIFGGGHVGQALCELARVMGTFRVTVFDDRPEYATRERHPHADQLVVTETEYVGGVPTPDSTTFVVIATWSHDLDQKLVARFMACERAYLGMIGSVSKRRAMMAELEAGGADPKQLETIDTPIGIPLGGKALPEVALSIMARLVQVKNQLEKGGSRL